MISPHRQIVPIDAIHGQCVVLDPKTFCLGRPVGKIHLKFITFGNFVKE